MRIPIALLTVLGLLFLGCGEDDANEQKIGGECVTADDCDDGDDDTPALDCILDFKGGYCGRANCQTSEDCPEGSSCADLEGSFYCFLHCTDKAQCNQNRSVENESNCSSSVDPVEGGELKLCIPPSG
jgi:hypothetical protein